MKQLKLIAPLLCVALLAFLSGCGSEHRESSSPGQVVASQACLGCHNGTLSRVTGVSVASEWLQSAHSTASGGAGCDDCHHVGNHPQNGAIPTLPNTTVCVQCHTATVPMTTKAAHFSNLSASYTGFRLSRINSTIPNPVPITVAQYANANQVQSGCNICHNPHDPTSLLAVNRQWAASGHAETTDDAFKEQVFIKNTTCQRCHSATGFRYYVTHAQGTINAAGLGQYSSAREVIACNACHTDFTWKRISSDPAVTTFINFSTPYAKFPNVTKRIPGSTNPTPTIGDSKICVPCHAGRTGARVGAAIVFQNPLVAATNVPPFDSHYFPAAAVMYGKIGFINFTSQGTVLPAVAAVTQAGGTFAVGSLSALGASTYGQSLITSDDIAGGVTSTHRKLGTTAINGDGHNPSFFTPGHLDSNGPCVVCHMTAGHTLNFEDPAINANTYNQVCINCHTSERGVPLTAQNFMTAFVDENREQMFNALALAVAVLEQNYDITINLSDDEAQETPQDVSFLVKSSGVSLSSQANWTAYLNAHPTFTAAQVYKLKGALFNIIVSYKENTSYLHARSLTRRLIYDAIDFLDDGLMNMSVGTTALSPVGQAVLDSAGHIAFKKGPKAFVTDTSGALDPATTASMTYIIAFDRTTGNWEPPQRERP